MSWDNLANLELYAEHNNFPYFVHPITTSVQMKAYIYGYYFDNYWLAMVWLKYLIKKLKAEHHDFKIENRK